jgi:hypothetical protein
MNSIKRIFACLAIITSLLVAQNVWSFSGAFVFDDVVGELCTLPDEEGAITVPESGTCEGGDLLTIYGLRPNFWGVGSNCVWPDVGDVVKVEYVTSPCDRSVATSIFTDPDTENECEIFIRPGWKAGQ